MADEMFFTEDERSLRRGKRRAPRTETCRPCLVWPIDAPDRQCQAVAMDMNPHGMLVRMLEVIPVDTEVSIQLMRDENFREPLAAPARGKIVRTTDAAGGFTDHGIQLVQPEVRRTESKPVRFEKRTPLRYRKPRMHTIDVTLGERGKGRSPRR
ncbi:MAG TPA: hypothetical protein HPP77_00445 [Candidatus Hydrogenedentes bacterium]|nr:hypothetical protein [Candidatus Hydrogenedentota bacterium]HIJ74533.1 hypothetical protein [Candidatus Hydrogenedentota bacterium]